MSEIVRLIGLIHRSFCSTDCFLNVLGADGGMKETVDRIGTMTTGLW